MIADYLAVACRCLIAVVFGVSLIGKLRGRAAFAEFGRATRRMLSAVPPWRAVSHATAARVAYVVAGAEAFVAVSLVVPSTVVPEAAGAGLVVAAGLLIAFSAGIAMVLRAGVRTPCRCFGSSSAPVGRPHLVRNAVLLGAAITGLLAGPGNAGPLHAAGVAIAATVAVVIAVLVIRLDDLVEVFAG
ncbi:MauE/DoxX family redox-associated membrane protein [Nonomuraea sp. NPDC050643]|uniref:MauE/DoxX family redox-associated membrane protein n=1 Tax=Nonomuraea sp. NPDC050643 TaxID=3155660 RepID=UPI0034106AFC